MGVVTEVRLQELPHWVIRALAIMKVKHEVLLGQATLLRHNTLSILVKTP